MSCLTSKLRMTVTGRRSWTTAAENVERFSKSLSLRYGRTPITTAGRPVMLLRGFAKGVPTKHLADEMDLAYPSVLKRRHRIQKALQQGERVGLPARRRKMG